MGYRVRYIGRDLPARDFDGCSAGLRLLLDGEYVQYFRVIASAPDLLRLEPKPGHDWWTEFITAAARQIRELVEAGQLQPRPPGEPMFLRPDVAAVQQLARQPNPTRRHFTTTEPGLEGVDVLRFGEGEEVGERRRAPR